VEVADDDDQVERRRGLGWRVAFEIHEGEARAGAVTRRERLRALECGRIHVPALRVPAFEREEHRRAARATGEVQSPARSRKAVARAARLALDERRGRPEPYRGRMRSPGPGLLAERAIEPGGVRVPHRGQRCRRLERARRGLVHHEHGRLARGQLGAARAELLPRDPARTLEVAAGERLLVAHVEDPRLRQRRERAGERREAARRDGGVASGRPAHRSTMTPVLALAPSCVTRAK
jgi:hypothetical protein